MKYHKFRSLAKSYPWLVDILDPLGYLRHNIKTSSFEARVTPRLKNFVRHQLEYVAFRPYVHLPDPVFATLGSYETTQTLEHAVRCDPYFGGNYDNSYHTEWEIVWRVGDQLPATSPHRDGFTLCESMIEIQMDYERGLFGEGGLNFDYVVKRITESTGKGGTEKMSIEIFSLSEFQFLSEEVIGTKIPPTRMNYNELEAYRARVRVQADSLC